ncbi:MAG: DegT/DnrJ/EryC1/StrS family aminotransferase [Novosphingobium sp.]|nr:DegT/DnrJ/EryC1/StrS family aminotransferase [Novosphingobium sp.]
MTSDFATWPCFSKEEADAVSQVLLSNRVNYHTGEIGGKFEEEFAKWSDCEYAVAVANGTVALDLALNALSCPSSDNLRRMAS